MLKKLNNNDPPNPNNPNPNNPNPNNNPYVLLLGAPLLLSALKKIMIMLNN